ncbi:MAG TPA: hypothetical protein VFK44_10295 [Bacillales bacterium]|nr:hypothetical protein [Bacillales bacterium]
MKVTKKKMFLLSVTAVFSLSFVSWAFTSQLLQLHITTDSALPGGKAAAITSIVDGSAFDVHKGRPQKIAGIPLYKIELGNERYSELAQIYLSATNFVQANGETNLVKSNWWMDVGVYYPIVDASAADLILDDGTALKKFTADKAMVHLNRTKATGILMPGKIVPGNTTLYIIASYVSPAGSLPPGQQKQLNQLQFHCMVRM